MQYDQLTYVQRIALNLQQQGVGYVCYQTNQYQNYLVGYYRITPSYSWEYIGTRPPHRID